MPVKSINRFRISKALICLSLGLIVAAGVLPSGAKTKIVSFKDAAKLKTWDADDARSAQKWEEMRCVTREKLETLDLGLEEIGRLKVRHARDIKASGWSIGCETMDRDYSDWDQYKHFVGMLGAKRGRLFSGWAKTEQEKGIYDFAWLDRQVREMAAMGVKPWICLSYGNPVWGSDFRLGMRVKQITDDPEAFKAWLRYCRACVERYKDVVDEWEVWNEPFKQGSEYAELFYRTAKAVKEIQPEGRVYCTAIEFPKDYKEVLEKLKAENALHLGSLFIYHPYDENPDMSYTKYTEPMRALVKSYDSSYDVMQGESGCPAQVEWGHALRYIEWSEYSQAKWSLRRTIGDAVRSIRSNVFTMIDLQYTFMLQSFGMLRSNTLKEVIYRRPVYFAMQNVFSTIDCDVVAESVLTNAPVRATSLAVDAEGTFDPALTVARFSRASKPLVFCWYSGRRPSSRLTFDRVTIALDGVFTRPVLVEMITGRVFRIPDSSVRSNASQTVLSDIPMWDSPLMIADESAVPRTLKDKK